MQFIPHKIRIHHYEDLPELVKLEVKKLGRPWHKLPSIINDHFDILDTKLSTYFLKKLRVNVTLKNISFTTDSHHRDTQIFSTAYGNIAFDIDRHLLLGILHDYYGLSCDDEQNIPDTKLPVTKTEDRLKNKLGQELTHLIINKETFGEELDIKNDYSVLINQWPWCITFTLEEYQQGSFTIMLDQAHIDRMLATLRTPDSEASNNTSPISATQIERMFYNLPLKLQGRVASLNLTVAQLVNIDAGDIIPISLHEPMPVFISNEPIYHAVIAQDRGKLFLSEFTDKTSDKNYE